MPKTTIACAIIIRDENRILLARKLGRQDLVLPGGKVKPGESAETALRREIESELKVSDVHIIHRVGGCVSPDGEKEDVWFVVDCEGQEPQIGEPTVFSELVEVSVSELSGSKVSDSLGRLISYTKPFEGGGSYLKERAK